MASAPGVFGDISENETERQKRSARPRILDRAVDSNPICVELKLELLRLCRELWELAALLKEWKKLVFLHPNSPPPHCGGSTCCLCKAIQHLLCVKGQYGVREVSEHTGGSAGWEHVVSPGAAGH